MIGDSNLNSNEINLNSSNSSNHSDNENNLLIQENLHHTNQTNGDLYSINPINVSNQENNISSIEDYNQLKENDYFSPLRYSLSQSNHSKSQLSSPIQYSNNDSSGIINDQLTKRLSRLEKLVEDKSNQLNAHTFQRKVLENEINVLNDELSDLRKRLQDDRQELMEVIFSKDMEITQLKSEINRLKDSLEESRQLNESLCFKLTKYTNEEDKIIENYQNNEIQLNQQIENQKLSINNLNTLIKQKDNKIHDIQLQMDEISQNITEILIENEEMKNSINSSQKIFYMQENAFTLEKEALENKYKSELERIKCDVENLYNTVQSHKNLSSNNDSNFNNTNNTVEKNGSSHDLNDISNETNINTSFTSEVKDIDLTMLKIKNKENLIQEREAFQNQIRNLNEMYLGIFEKYSNDITNILNSKEEELENTSNKIKQNLEEKYQKIILEKNHDITSLNHQISILKYHLENKLSKVINQPNQSNQSNQSNRIENEDLLKVSNSPDRIIAPLHDFSKYNTFELHDNQQNKSQNLNSQLEIDFNSLDESIIGSISHSPQISINTDESINYSNNIDHSSSLQLEDNSNTNENPIYNTKTKTSRVHDLKKQFMERNKLIERKLLESSSDLSHVIKQLNSND